MESVNRVELTTYSKNLDITRQLDRTLETCLQAVKGTLEEYGFEDVSTVIAGGAVRDTLLGVPLRGINIFMRTPEGESAEDFPLFIAGMYALKHGGWVMDVSLGYTERATTSHTAKVTNGDFPLYFITCDEKPDGLLEVLDHALVRCYYDGEYHVHKDFDLSVKSGRVQAYNKQAENRLKRFRDRTGYKITIGRPPKGISSIFDSF